MIFWNASPKWRVWLLVLALAGAGCERLSGGVAASEEQLSLIGRLQLPRAVASGATLRAEPDGRLWIGSGGTLLGLAAGGAEPPVWIEANVQRTPRALGSGVGRLYVRAGDELFTVDPAAGELRARREGLGSGLIALDPRERHVYLATELGAVLGLDPRLLRPVWAWPRLGRPVSAAVSSPAGERLYMALAPDEPGGEARLLSRDVQTGRVFGDTALPGPVWQLLATPTETVVALAGAGPAAELIALRPTPEGLERLWRRSLGELGLEPPVELRLDPGGRRLLLFRPGREGEIYVVDAVTGRAAAAGLDAPLDADFGADGTLYLLYAEEIRLVR